jgi:hypothetical protein
MHFESTIEEEEFLNMQGKQGWRLVMVKIADMGKSYYYFEKEILSHE